MLKRNLVGLGALAAITAASALGGALLAQAPAGARETVQLAFGYECADRFMVRNDGAQAVDVEYGVQGASARSKLHLNAKESAEMSSTSTSSVELWVNGKLVATERKGNRACAPPVQSSPEVIVRPITPDDQAGYSQAAPYTSASPVVVVAPRPYYYDPYYYDPFYYPYYRTSISIGFPFGYRGFYGGHYGGGRGVIVGGRGRRR